MTQRALWNIAASGLVMGTVLSGCAGADLTRLSPASQPGELAQAADESADASRRLAGKGDRAGALAAAEAAVAADPANAGHRALLGHAYLAAGRFASAQTAFADAMALGQTDGKTAVSLALALSANGDGRAAVGVLDEHRNDISASDYGLALALAGEPERAIMVLNDAARAEGATAQTRQNLAFAYAMGGHWLEAKLIAAQDMSIAKLDTRMTEWAALVQAPSPDLRVAGLMGVRPAADPGLPVRLALVDAPDAQAALADEAVADLASYDPIADAPLAPVEYAAPLAVEYAAPAVPLAAEEAEPYRAAVAQMLALNAPVEDAAIAPQTRLDRVADAAPDTVDMPKTVSRVAASPAAADGASTRTGWAVQLGAFSSNAAAQRAWTLYSKRFASLDGYSAMSHYATVNGRGYYRLTANAVGSRQAARALCGAVKASGGVCFVRNLSGREDVRWASQGSATRLAAR